MNQQDQQGKTLTQSELESIIRGGKFTSQSDANTYLQQHGLSAVMKDDGSADILDGNQKRVAVIKFQGSGQDQRQVSNISYPSS